MNTEMFQEKISLIADPYYDREFFTNLIYMADRGKLPRDVFEAYVDQYSLSPEFNDEMDRSLLQIFYAYQASSSVREGYQWLPLSQSLYAASLFRGDGRKPFGWKEAPHSEGRATTLAEFTDLIRSEVRAVESKDKAWSSLLFLLENRTTRSGALTAWLRTATLYSDPLTFALVMKGIEVALASGWKANASILRRPFDRFWAHPKPSEVVAQGWRMSRAVSAESGAGAWEDSWAQDLWKRISEQSVESALELISRMCQKGASFDQIFAVLSVLRGRCLLAMGSDQWSRVSSSIIFGDCLQSAARWLPEDRLMLLTTSVCELAKVAQLTGPGDFNRPTGGKILDGTSKNISKDRLILRLDDCCERGERDEALEILAVILKDQGLSNTLRDRLILMASKQDAWTFDQRTIAVASILTQGHEHALRLQMFGTWANDALWGLLRFLCDERDVSMEVVAKTGTYGNKVSRSQYDVSGGARIVDRFVFNQLRNGQRVKVWPSDN